MKRLLACIALIAFAVLGASGIAEAATPVTITNVTVQNGVATVTWTPLPADHGVTSNGLYNGAFTVCVVPHGDVPDSDLWDLCSTQYGGWSPVISGLDGADSSATSWTGSPTGVLSSWQTGEYDAYVVYFDCDDYGVCITPVVSPPYTFKVTVKAPPPPAVKIPKDSLYVTETVEGGANQWVKVEVSYLFGYLCTEDDPSWPDCSPAPDLQLTVYRLGHVRIKVGKHFKTVKTKSAVYSLSDTGINDGNSGGSMFVPYLVPAADFRGGAKNGTYLIRVTSDLSGNPSDSATFEIVGEQLLDG